VQELRCAHRGRRHQFPAEPGARHALIVRTAPERPPSSICHRRAVPLLRPDRARGERHHCDGPGQALLSSAWENFQINALFRRLPVLDNVALAVASRACAAACCVRQAPMATSATRPWSCSPRSAHEDAGIRIPDLPYGTALVEIAIALGLNPMCCSSTSPPRACLRWNRIASCSARQAPRAHRDPDHRA